MYKKKFNLQVISFSLCIFLIAGMITGCGNQTPVTPMDDAEFDSWVNDYFAECVMADTLDLHYTLENPATYGITDYEVTLGDCSQEAVNEAAKEDEDVLAELKGFDYDGLTDKQKLIYDILKDRLELSIEAADYPYYDEPLSPMIGTQSTLPSLLAEYALNSRKDVEDYLTLLADWDRYFEDLLTYEQEKSEAGLFMSDKILDMTINDLDSFIEDSDNSFLIETFENRIKNVPDLTKEEIKSYSDRNEALIKGEVTTAYKKLKTGLEKLRGTGKNDGGLGNFKKGKAYYKYLLRTSIGTDKSVSKLEKMTKKKMDDDITTFSDLYYGSSGLSDKADSFSFTLTDPEECLADLQQKMLRDFPALNADVNVQLKKVSASMEDSTSPAYYLISALDNLQENVIYINYGLSDKSTLYSTMAHEGYPGHLYQTVYSGTCDSTPIRRLLETSGFSEGWATYVEILSYDYDTSQDQNLLTMMQANVSCSLEIYAMIDYYINYEKCTKDEIQRWLSNYMSLSNDDFDDLYYTVLSQPANYLNYYVGYLEILNLKEEAEDELGNRFNLKEFHTFLLETGNAPFYIIEDHMADWISEQKEEADNAA